MSNVDLKQIKRQTIISEHEAILNAIRDCLGHKGKAAQKLGIDRKTLYNKINRYKKEILNEN